MKTPFVCVVIFFITNLISWAAILSGSFDYSGYGVGNQTAQFTYDTTSNGGTITGFGTGIYGGGGSWYFSLITVPYGPTPNIADFADLTNLAERTYVQGQSTITYNYDWSLFQSPVYQGLITGRDIYGIGGPSIPTAWIDFPPQGSSNSPSYLGTVSSFSNPVPEPAVFLELLLGLVFLCGMRTYSRSYPYF